MIFVDKSTGEFFAEGAFRSKITDRSLPEKLTAEVVESVGFAMVSTTPAKPGETTYKVVQVDGVWKQVWYAETVSADNVKSALKEAIRRQIQSHLDATAKELGYDNIVSAASYKDSTDPNFRQDAEKLISMRDKYWRATFSVQDEIVRSDLDGDVQTLQRLVREIHSRAQSA